MEVGNRGIYHKGWSAVTKHKTPWLLVGEQVPAFDDDVWELYDTTTDWSQARELSSEMPEKLHELQRLWLIERPGMVSCRSTIAWASAFFPRWRATRRSSKVTPSCSSVAWGAFPRTQSSTSKTSHTLSARRLWCPNQGLRG
jgi:hypothetical protein